MARHHRNKRQKNKNNSNKGAASITSTSSATATPKKTSSHTPLPSKNTHRLPFKAKIWLIFGVGVTLLAIFVAIIYDLSLGGCFEEIRDSRFPDFVLAILAISASVVNIIIDLKTDIDINTKINYAIFPAFTMAIALSYYSFLYGRGDEIAFLKWNWVLPISTLILLINIGIGFILSKK